MVDGYYVQVEQWWRATPGYWDMVQLEILLQF
jgi:hypothetical protein